MAKEISDKMANRLWTARRSTTLSDSQLAKEIGVSKSQLRRVFGEGRRNVSDTTYEKLRQFAYYDD